MTTTKEKKNQATNRDRTCKICLLSSILVYVYAVIGRKAILIVYRDLQLHKQHCDSENNDEIKAATNEWYWSRQVYLDGVG